MTDNARGRLVLVTGATGYIGGRLVPALLREGYRVRVLVRTPQKLQDAPWLERVEVVTGDASSIDDVSAACAGVHTAFYLLHSLGSGAAFAELESAMARTFAQGARQNTVSQVVYLGGIANDENLSDHLGSRAQVGEELRSTSVPVLELRAGIVIGSGSASFEMLRYLTEHLPVMVTPRWTANRTQPISVSDVLHYLVSAASLQEPVNAIADIGGPDVVDYRQMMNRYAHVAGLRSRVIIPVPLLTPRLSSLWVGLVTPVPSSIARPLVGSLVNEVVASPTRDVHRVLPPPPGGLIPFDEALSRALDQSVSGAVDTRWSDASVPWSPWHSASTDPDWAGGTLLEDRRTVVTDATVERVWQSVESLGGSIGWHGMGWAWKLRGAADRAIGGVGLGRGRRDPLKLRVGDGVDFWRVEHIDRGHQLRLRSEMRMPGDAWLEFTVESLPQGTKLTQLATFRPRGLAGRVYWGALSPFHAALFPRMARHIAQGTTSGRELTGRGAPPASP